MVTVFVSSFPSFLDHMREKLATNDGGQSCTLLPLLENYSKLQGYSHNSLMEGRKYRHTNVDKLMEAYLSGLYFFLPEGLQRL